jgi:hypothetical protein
LKKGISRVKEAIILMWDELVGQIRVEEEDLRPSSKDSTHLKVVKHDGEGGSKNPGFPKKLDCMLPLSLFFVLMVSDPIPDSLPVIGFADDVSFWITLFILTMESMGTRLGYRQIAQTVMEKGQPMMRAMRRFPGLSQSA